MCTHLLHPSPGSGSHTTSNSVQCFCPNTNSRPRWARITQLIPMAPGTLHPPPQGWQTEKRATTASQPAAPLPSWRKHLRGVFSSSPSSQMRWWRGKEKARTTYDRTGRKIALGFWWVSALPPHGSTWGAALTPPPQPIQEEGRVVKSCGKGLSSYRAKNVSNLSDPQSYLNILSLPPLSTGTVWPWIR